MTQPPSSSAANKSTRGRPVLAVHGGAGTVLRSAMSPDKAVQYSAALERVLRAGQQRLEAGECALEVVVQAVRDLEECELFNAGRGSVYTAAATHELDACVMSGHGLRAGAVAGLRTTRNPVLAARAVMERSEHVLFFGAAADAFAARQGLEQVAPEWFGTPLRLQQLQRAQALAAGVLLDHDAPTPTTDTGAAPLDESRKFGTVGAVALDASGHLAAATSTGGMTNKQVGRVGDTPLIGAGCYANDATVAVSCTGTGEPFMRALAAHEVSALMAYAGLTLHEAAQRVVMESVAALGGRGGLIAVDARGEVCMPFNTEGMYRGFARVGEAPVVAIYRDGQP